MCTLDQSCESFPEIYAQLIKLGQLNTLQQNQNLFRPKKLRIIALNLFTDYIFYFVAELTSFVNSI